ncbi:MAG TPA: helicase-related protein [Candidatus Norongarragalinales archaeon]|nr:helicase-related protein [Candidatus Norongarragalinales archaeon]
MDEGTTNFLNELSLTPAGEGLEAREYQLNIARSILRKGNTLVVMPTALGKTYVAVFVIARFVKQMREGKMGRKKILFLAPTKPLAVQQAKKIAELVDFGGGSATQDKLEGEGNNEALAGLGKGIVGSKQTRNNQNQNNQLESGATPEVMVMSGETQPEKREKYWIAEEIWCYVATPQTVEFDVLAGRMSLDDFCFVIFDEAHRAVKDYSYSFLARETTKRNILSIGLTASPSGKKERIDEICSNLQIRNIEIRSDADMDVRKYGHQINMDWVFVELPPGLLKLKRQLLEMLKEVLQELRGLGVIGSIELKGHKRELLGLRQRALANLSKDPGNYQVLSLHARAMNISHAVDLVEIEGVHPLLQFMREMEGRSGQSKAVRILLADPRWLQVQLDCMDLIGIGEEHPKFKKLHEIIKGQIKTNERIIVFAHYRNTVTKIVAELGNIEGARPVEFIGKSKGGMGQKQQQHVMQSFREGNYNVLVATSVAEEGLDIPEVGLVVFFEAVPSEIRLIQRRGRTGRAKEGKVVVLITKGSKDEAMFWSSRNKEREMRKVVEKMRNSELALDEGQEDLTPTTRPATLKY